MRGLHACTCLSGLQLTSCKLNRNSWIHQIENASKFLRDKKKFIQSQEEQCMTFYIAVTSWCRVVNIVFVVRKSRGKGIGTLIVRVVEASNLSVADITGDLVWVSS